jgi:hypothetical protein
LTHRIAIRKQFARQVLVDDKWSAFGIRFGEVASGDQRHPHGG